MDENLELAIVDELLDEGVVTFDRTAFLTANPPERDDDEYEPDEEWHFYRRNPAIASALCRLLRPEHLPAIKHIRWSGGMRVQHLVFNYWDGEDDLFDIESLVGVEECTSLVTLSIRDANAVKDLTPLASLPSLESLAIGGGGHPKLIEDVSPLVRLSKLRRLDLSYNRTLHNVTPLAALTSLEELDLSYCAVTDFSFADTLPRLRKLVTTGQAR